MQMSCSISHTTDLPRHNVLLTFAAVRVRTALELAAALAAGRAVLPPAAPWASGLEPEACSSCLASIRPRARARTASAAAALRGRRRRRPRASGSLSSQLLLA